MINKLKEVCRNKNTPNVLNEIVSLSAVSQLKFRQSKKRYVFFKNIPDNYNDEEDLQFMTTLLDPDKINVRLDLDSITTFRLGRFEKNKLLPRLLKVRS